MEGRRVIVPAFAESPEAGIASARLEPQPPPERLAPDEVRVRVVAAAVGWVDLLMTSGQYQHMPSPPYVPGLEGAGEVVETGAGVTRWRPGDRVIIDGFSVGPRSLGAYQSQGTFATWVVAPEHGLVPLPPTLSFDAGAALLSSYETAWHCLVARGRLAAGEVVLIHGASGATGLAAVQIAKLLGATVIATGRSADKLAVVSAHGADHVIAIGGDAGVRPFRDEVKALTAGRGVDVVYDGVGGDVSIESLRCVRFGARFLVVGWASTPAVARGHGQRGAPNANQLPTNLIMMKGLDVLGCPTAISTAVDPTIRAPRLAQILSWAAAGQLTPHVSHTFALDDFQAAMRAKWGGAVVGGCVLHPCHEGQGPA